MPNLLEACLRNEVEMRAESSEDKLVNSIIEFLFSVSMLQGELG